MTAAERAAQINDEVVSCNDGDVIFLLSTDTAHWAAYNIHTGEQLDCFLAINEYVSLHKELYGFKPRNMNFDGMTCAEIENESQKLYRRHADTKSDANTQLDTDNGEPLKVSWFDAGLLR